MEAATWTADVGCDDAADGRFPRKTRIEGNRLPVLRERPRQAGVRQAGLDADGEVTRLILENAVETSGRNRDVGGFDGPGHEPLRIVTGNRGGLPSRTRLAERRREFGASGGTEHASAAD